MLRACRRTVDVAIRSSQSPRHRALSRSAPALLPRQISNIVLPSNGTPPKDDDSIAGAFISNRPRQPRAGRSAKGGPSGSAGGSSSNPIPPPKQPPLPTSFVETYLTTPAAAEPVTPQIRSLRNLLLASFSPAIQKGLVDPTLAIVCPLEGGEHVIREALSKAAGLLGADVVRLEAIECLGLRQFGGLGEAGTCLFLSPNPVLLAESDTSSPSDEAEENDDEGESDGEDGEFSVEDRPVEIHIPIGGFSGGIGGGPRGPFGPFGPFGVGTGAREAQQGKSEEKHRIDKLFNDIVNVEHSASSDDRAGSSQRRRIIYIQDATAMASTFEQWFPSLKAAVNARRSQAEGQAEGQLCPTTIVLGCNPSLLHLAPNMRKEEANAAAAAAAAASQSAPNSPTSGIGFSISSSPMIRALTSGLAGPFGGGMGDSERKSKGGELWMSSEEDDVTGRRLRLGKRLKGFSSQSERALRDMLPPFEASSGSGKSNAPSGAPAGLKAFMASLGAMEVPNPAGLTDHSESKSDVNVWKVIGVLPEKRNVSAEVGERMNQRLRINTLLLKKALGQLSMPLTESLPGDELNEDANQTGLAMSEISQELQSLRESFVTSIWSWSALQHFATVIVGHVLSQPDADSNAVSPPVTWKAIAEASLLDEQCDDVHSLWISANHKQGAVHAEAESSFEENEEATTAPSVDPVVEALKRDRSLSQHERRLLGCIVDPNKLSATTFDDVQLPEKTIDAVRTVVSLPLLYPEAFHSGILAQHSTSGCLLFGPPGTGKTLLVRALARDSGARMLAVQPSDVTDMYVGEGEKLVKAVFSLARRLSPCIIFLDEVDSLFGARSSRGAGGGAQAHRQVLTEFMQEMDGLSSATANKEKQIIVMGATNRPYDLDEAVLRRLPRRLLVDLPGEQERLAILKIHLKHERLADDVDLAKIAKDTDTYSGSDLKHLCVSAALAAIKEMVPIPWKARKKDTSPLMSTTPSESLSGPEPDVLKLVDDLQRDDRMFQEPIKPVTSTLERDVRVTPSLVDPPNSQELELPEGLVHQDEASGDHISDITSRGNEKLDHIRADTLKSLPGDPTPSVVPLVDGMNDSAGDTQGGPKTPEADHEHSEEIAVRRRKSIPPRVLKASHFELATKEITPSSSENGNLPELRKWAEQYGEGGTKRGKKMGYGSKFGFGDAKEQKGDPGYGRVRPEEDDTKQA